MGGGGVLHNYSIWQERCGITELLYSLMGVGSQFHEVFYMQEHFLHILFSDFFQEHISIAQTVSHMFCLITSGNYFFCINSFMLICKCFLTNVSFPWQWVYFFLNALSLTFPTVKLCIYWNKKTTLFFKDALLSGNYLQIGSVGGYKIVYDLDGEEWVTKNSRTLILKFVTTSPSSHHN
jgi:hypothetical protein